MKYKINIDIPELDLELQDDEWNKEYITIDKLSEQLLLMTQIIFTLLEFIEMMTLGKLLLLKLQVVELN